MSDLSDLLRRAEPPMSGFTPDDVVRRAAANRRRARVAGAAVTCVVLAVVVSVVVAARPELTVQLITPPHPTSMPASEGTITPETGGDLGRADELLGVIRELPEEEVGGAPTGWRVIDGETPWRLTRGVNPDGTFCLVRGAHEGTRGVDVDSDCGVVPFAITVGEPSEEMVGVVVPDGYDRAVHDGATVEVTNNVAILPADGSDQPTVAVTGPAGTLDVTANLAYPAALIPPDLALDGGHTAGPAEIAAVVAEVTEPGTSGPTTARAADSGPTTTTVVLRFGEPYQGSACISLVTTARTDASCIPLDEDVRVIADGPLLAAVAAEGVRAYLVQDGWQALQLPNGRQVRATANTVTVPADAESAATGLLLHADGREVLVALHRPPDSGTVRTGPKISTGLPSSRVLNPVRASVRTRRH